MKREKELVWVVIYQIFALSSVVVINKLITTLYSKEVFSFFILITSYMALLSAVIFNPYNQGVLKYFGFFNGKQRGGQILGVLHKQFLVLLILTTICFLALRFVFPWDYADLTYLYVVSEVLKNYLRALQNSIRNRKGNAISSILEFTLKIFFLCLFEHKVIEFLLIALIIGNLIGSILLIRAQRLSGFKSQKFEGFFRRRLFLYSSPFVLWGLFGWLRDVVNRLYIDTFLDHEILTSFYIISSVSLIIPQAANAVINTYYAPIIFQNKSGNNRQIKDLIDRISMGYIFGIFVAVIPVFFLHQEIVTLFSSATYTNLSWAMPYTFIAVSFYSLAQIAALKLLSIGDSKSLVYANVLPGIFSLIFGFLLIKWYNTSGALIAHFLTYGLYSALIFYTVYIKYDKAIKKN